MICDPCRDNNHVKCLNFVRAPITPNWCDCQHRSTLTEQTNRERVNAVKARRKPRPSMAALSGGEQSTNP